MCTLLFYLFNHLWLLGVFIAARGLSPAVESRGYSLAALNEVLIAAAPPVAVRRLQMRGLQHLQPSGSAVVIPTLSCSRACGILPNQGSNLCPCIGSWILIYSTTWEVVTIKTLF